MALAVFRVMVRVMVKIKDRGMVKVMVRVMVKDKGMVKNPTKMIKFKLKGK